MDTPDVQPAGSRRMMVTIAILTFNGEEFLEELLAACSHQEGAFDSEILVIDSGSTDRTVEIARRHRAVRLVEIPNQEFGHGRTRNLAARLARGEIVAFLTQDATPATSQWLAELVCPFEDETVAGTFGRQIPRSSCCPTVKRDVIEAFRDPAPAFFSNVNSAVRRTVLAQIPFRDVGYAEDLAFARDVLEAGYRTAYSPGGSVWHSHNLSIPDYFRRMYDEAQGVRESGARPGTGRGIPWLVAATVRGTVKDWWFILADGDYGHWVATRWMLKAPLYNIARRLAIWLAYRDRLPSWLRARLSLDSRRRKLARSRAS